jgi:hypothetical protein
MTNIMDVFNAPLPEHSFKLNAEPAALQDFTLKSTKILTPLLVRYALFLHKPVNLLLTISLVYKAMFLTKETALKSVEMENI